MGPTTKIYVTENFLYYFLKRVLTFKNDISICPNWGIQQKVKL